MAGVLRKFTNVLGPATGGLARQGYAIDWSHPMAKDLSFCVLLNSRSVRDLVGAARYDNGSGATALTFQGLPVDVPSGTVEELTPYGPGLQFTNLDNSKLDFGIQQPIIGGGPNGIDMTVLVIANPAASGTQQPTIFSQRKQADGQIDIICNSTATNAQASGDVAFFLVNATIGNNVSAATSTGTAVDGNYHVYVGRILDVSSPGSPNGTSTMWVDGILPTGVTGTAIGGTFFLPTQKMAVSGLADAAVDSYTANCSVPLVMTWNRALSNDEILSISLDPYQFIIPEETDVPTLAALQAAIAGSTIMLGQGWM